MKTILKAAGVIALLCAFVGVMYWAVWLENEYKDHGHVTETYTFERELAYAYFGYNAIKNVYGGIKDYSEHFLYGVVTPDGAVDNEDDYSEPKWYFEEHTLNVSDRSYILYTAQKTTCAECGVIQDQIIDYDFYLSPDMMQKIGNGGA